MPRRRRERRPRRPRLSSAAFRRLFRRRLFGSGRALPRPAVPASAARGRVRTSWAAPGDGGVRAVAGWSGTSSVGVPSATSAIASAASASGGEAVSGSSVTSAVGFTAVLGGLRAAPAGGGAIGRASGSEARSVGGASPGGCARAGGGRGGGVCGRHAWRRGMSTPPVRTRRLAAGASALGPTGGFNRRCGWACDGGLPARRSAARRVRAAGRGPVRRARPSGASAGAASRSGSASVGSGAAVRRPRRRAGGGASAVLGRRLGGDVCGGGGFGLGLARAAPPGWLGGFVWGRRVGRGGRRVRGHRGRPERRRVFRVAFSADGAGVRRVLGMILNCLSVREIGASAATLTLLY